MAKLATDATKVVTQEGQMYAFEDRKYRGWDAFVNGLDTDPEFMNKVVEAVKKTDLHMKL